jgi:hypothetical protein
LAKELHFKLFQKKIRYFEKTQSEKGFGAIRHKKQSISMTNYVVAYSHSQLIKNGEKSR